MTTTPLLLIDADILLYKAANSAEYEVEVEDDLWVMYSDLRVAKDSFIEQLDSIRNSTGYANPKILLCFSDSNNFRKDVYPHYKNKRKKTRKPMGFQAFKDWAVHAYPSVIKPSLEADDCIGILATKPGAYTIIYSEDKDLMQIPGYHWVNGVQYFVDEANADAFFYSQVLTGDPTDNYPGCPGVGKVKAAKLLDKVAKGDASYWEVVVEAYKDAGQTEEDALAQARVARILRWDDWDSNKQEPILWQPST